MTTAIPVGPIDAVPVVPLGEAVRREVVKASVLAALQLVEDARTFGTERRPQRERARLIAERTVAARRLARDRTVL